MKQEVTNPQSSARRYEHSIKGLTRQNHHCAVSSRAGFICIAPPKIPPLADYEAWLASVPDHPTAPREIDANMMRRIVTMRANGCSQAEIGNSIGKRGPFVSRWLKRLPAALGGASPSPDPGEPGLNTSPLSPLPPPFRPTQLSMERYDV